MKRHLALILTGITACLIISCTTKTSSKGSADNNSPNKDSTAINNDSLEHPIMLETLSDLNQWFNIKPEDAQSEQESRLIDLYNSAVIWASILTDFDLQNRFEFENENVLNAVKTIDVSIVKDQEIREKLSAYKKEMIYLMSVNPNDVDQDKHNPWKAADDLYRYISKKFYVTSFGKIDRDKYWKEYDICSSVPEWDKLKKKRGKANLYEKMESKCKAAKDIDARCVYAIELAHAYFPKRKSEVIDPPTQILESIMNEKKYSLYLDELWQKWRVLYQENKGASRDSEIPNSYYNKFRNICATTIFLHIRKHPKDIKAINQFLVIACKDNILREGEFEYGNQGLLEKARLFPELLNDSKD